MTQPVHLTERNEQKEFLDAIGTIMKICIPGITDIRKILEARVPIIKFFNQNTNMYCDLSSTNVYVVNISYLYKMLRLLLNLCMYIQSCVTYV